MAVHVIKKGLDLPCTGAPVQKIEAGAQTERVAVVASDYPYMKPRMRCSVGDVVKRGQVLFEDRKAEGVRFCAPGAGEIVAIHRGERRVLQSVVIKLTESERKGSPSADECVTFEAHTGKAPADLDRASVKALLAESGEWAAIRVRPHSRVPALAEECVALFVTAIDTNPLTADVDVVMAGQEEAFHHGLQVLEHLTDGPVFLNKKVGSKVTAGSSQKIQVEEWKGKHPAGLPGTHIHFLRPASAQNKVWYVGYQDVIAIGHLFKTGRLYTDRVYALAGPIVKAPRLIKSRVGADLLALTDGQMEDVEEYRLVDGSPLYGRHAQCERLGYKGRYFNQITLLKEDRERVFLGWLKPGADKFSTIRAIVGGILPKKFAFTTTTHGSHRAMVPIGMFERLMPLDIMPTFLLRAIEVDDITRAEALGLLELDEEDLALCSFVSPGKVDFAQALRRNLTEIWKEG